MIALHPAVQRLRIPMPLHLAQGRVAAFRQAFEFKMKGDKHPSGKAGELVEKVQALFAE